MALTVPNRVIFIKNDGSPLSVIDDPNIFWLSYLGPLSLNYLSFQASGFESRKTPFAPLDRTFAPQILCPFVPLNLNDPIGHLRHFLIDKKNLFRLQEYKN